MLKFVHMIKGIIFDLDGTTLSTLNDIQNALNETLRNFGMKEQTYDEVRLHVGSGAKKLVERSLPENMGEEELDRIYKAYIEEYGKSFDILTGPYDGIPETLAELQNKGIKLAVNSNKGNAPTNSLIKKHFPNIDFVAVYGSRAGIPNKPDPASANEIIEMMNLEKDEVLYVGDSETDIKTAKNAGLKSVGCLWGFRDRKTLEEAQTDIIVEKPQELLNCLE